MIPTESQLQKVKNNMGSLSDEDSVHLNTPPKGRGVCCAKEFCKNRSRSYYTNHKCVICKGHPHEQGCFTLGEIFCRYDPDKVVCLRCDHNQKKKEERRRVRERQERRRAVRRFEREKQEKKEAQRQEKIKKRNPFSIAADNAAKKA
jgi:hypothetical protein